MSSGPTSQQVVEDIYKHDLIIDIMDPLQRAMKANDRLAFGSYRQEHADELKKQLEIAKRKIENLLRRLP